MGDKGSRLGQLYDLGYKKNFCSPKMSYLQIQTFCQIYNKNFVVVSSSCFFSNSMAFSIESTKPWCWFEELLKLSSHVFTDFTGTSVESAFRRAGELLISSSSRDGGWPGDPLQKGRALVCYKGV